MNTRMMPGRGEMIAAFLSRDGSYDGFFFTGVQNSKLTSGVASPSLVYGSEPPAPNSSGWQRLLEIEQEG